MTRGGKTYYYQLNGHGDVVALTDSTGAVVNTYTYDAFGNLVSQTGTVENPYLYAGYRYDKETGLYYLQARYYNPDTGRFLTRDTMKGDSTHPITLNQYAYVSNNPVMQSDPTVHNPLLRLIYVIGRAILEALLIALVNTFGLMASIGDIGNGVFFGLSFYEIF